MNKVVDFKKAKEKLVPPTRAELEAKVHELSLTTSNIQMDCPHFKQRMGERGVTMRQVLEVLRHGDANDGPELDKWGDWRIRLCRKVAGRRVQVVVAVKENHLTAITVI